MLRDTAFGRNLLIPAFLGASLGIACNSSDGNGDGDDDGAICQRDPSTGPEEPIDGDPSMGVEGFVCPSGDEDWYLASVPDGSELLSVELSSSSNRSPIEPTYAVWSRNGSEAIDVVAAPHPDDVGNALSDTHCVGAGDYFVEVRDQGDNAQDRRNPYRLQTVASPQPDQNEPNASREEATAASMDPIEGYVACTGDEDWFVADVAVGEVIQARLRMDPTGIVPRLRIEAADGEQLAAASNESAVNDPTDLLLSRVVPEAGRYYVIVSDEGDRRSDRETPYSLEIATLTDLDGNEPNDNARDATPLANAPVDCGSGWSMTFEEQGTIGSAGDPDWFVLPTSGCTGGLVEVEVRMRTEGLSDADAWELQRKVQSAVALVREHGTSCSEDIDCRSLNLSCEDEWDCEGYFNACLPEGQCAGATMCLPGGQCGANQVQRNYRAAGVPDPIRGRPPENSVTLTAPLLAEGPVYLRVTDFQSDDGDPSVLYTVTVRIRQDPDPGDRAAIPNNLYANILTDEIPVSESQSRAISIPIHDCTAGDCCNGGTWETGSIGYENDLDWFTFDHPCSGSDCLFRVVYETDAGPVDHLMFIYQDEDLWVSRELETGTSGSFGGTGAGDSCIYAYFRHNDPYYVLMRDQADERESAPDQQYRFCIEKITNSCVAPCMDFGPMNGGCGQP